LDSQKLEFSELVQAFHKAGIKVILDVVFNQTAEGNKPAKKRGVSTGSSSLKLNIVTT
jgi:pullulanase/glycogen debranching enzyme